ncbi:hypothetical protein BJ085DRAFT_35034 [Dimargaris cristalligena]|uniref:CYRIA/CYRIB Rac1 binding domain-containing protein n=1 Tax=Dimargaris cristalligena TaxID=215637 RepID=A0A4P9ZZP5_9FUNG|nr:hypothetical protein BJ085DRAFT_35034 [Dimargaris cristalligena]|eukprot:RKP38601.1 hypothetical protein BJ085DRAFT_35034 [Dimargaris cristalligena]
MGAILSAFRSVAWESSSFSPYGDFLMDLQAPLDSNGDHPNYATAVQTIRNAAVLIQKLRSYPPCTDAIRMAISNPTPDNENSAWMQLTPSVGVLRQFFECSVELEKIIPDLIHPLCSDESLSVTSSFTKHGRLVRMLASILNISMDFDELKMSNPSIQNDFSFYRRTLHRLKQTSNPTLLDSIVPDDITNQMSLFYAYPNPMLRMVTDSLTSYVNKNESNANLVCEGLACLSAVCYNSLTRSGGQTGERALFSLRVIVASTILYDHLLPDGVFQRNSSINVPSVIQVIEKNPNTHSENLMNALRYSTKNLNQESTPKQVRAMLV